MTVMLFSSRMLHITLYFHADDNMAKSGFYTHENILKYKIGYIYMLCIQLLCTEYTIMYPYPYAEYT